MTVPTNDNHPPNGRESPGRPLTTEEIQVYLQRLDELQQAFSDIEDSCLATLDQWIQKAAGPYLPVMMRSSETTLAFLFHSDSQVRQAALHLAAYHWNTVPRIAPECEHLARTDSDETVRAAAIGVLGSCYARSKNGPITEFLAKTTLDNHQSDSVRIRAYISLIRVHGYSSHHGKPLAAIQSPVDFDWEFIYETLAGAE
jgi:hypothetical protein